MNHSLAKIFAASAILLSAAGCAAQQTQAAPATTGPTTAAPSGAAPSAAESTPTITPTTPPVVTTHASGVPVADLCAAGEKYLTRFPGLPTFQHNNDAQAAPGAIGCSYGVAPTASTPSALLTVIDIAVMKANATAGVTVSCGPDSQVPPGMTALDSLTSRPGWSGWKGLNVNIYQAMICTPTHAFAATLSNVPGATADDAVETILAVMK